MLGKKEKQRGCLKSAITKVKIRKGTWEIGGVMGYLEEKKGVSEGEPP